MKRTSSEATISTDHPAVAFHRELLIVQQWTAIRQAFLAELQSTAQHGVRWREPSKLWRHSQEALGKWILSQIARVSGVTGDRETASSTMPSASSTGVDPRMASLHFFPSATDFAGFVPNGRAYDEQLIRDLSLKSVGGEHDDAVVKKLVSLVHAFGLARRCDTARMAVDTQLAADVAHAQAAAAAGGQPMRGFLARPRLRRLEESDPSRSPAQRRVQGPLAEVSVEWPPHWGRPQCRHCPPVSMPWAAYEKLRRSYEHYNRAPGAVTAENSKGDEEIISLHRDDSNGAKDPLMPLSAAEAFLYRAAVVALRYEGGLATGSLQLCADTALKQHLHHRGYHVMDLCASPINAYMGMPAEGRFLAKRTNAATAKATTGSSASAETAAATQRTSSLEVEGVPNFFCSAFLDTDRFFGSLGSALRVDPLALATSMYVNGAQRPLLLTLDVPYDEDLCEMLFQKLVRDMQRAEASSAGSEGATATKTAVRVDYVLVLPLWWSIPMLIDKQLFCDNSPVSGESRDERAAAPLRAQAESKEAKAAAVLQVVQERSAMLRKGYQVPYTWPEDLAAAAGDARQPPTQQAPWVCFDSLFVGSSGYAYFCTATNRWLEGVTATEVIGLAQPGGKTHTADRMLLKASLEEYYL